MLKEVPDLMWTNYLDKKENMESCLKVVQKDMEQLSYEDLKREYLLLYEDYLHTRFRKVG